MTEEWKLKTERGKTYLTRDKDGFAFANPYSFTGTAKAEGHHSIKLTEKRKKTPIINLSILRWSGMQGEKPLLPEAVDGKKLKITIEVLPD